MIQLTRINHVPLVLNSDLIEHIETTPDTVISLTNGQKFVVTESTEEVVRRVIQFRRAIQPITGVKDAAGAKDAGVKE
jgi:flagellar protein FlbD